MKAPIRLAVIGVGDVAYRDYLPHIGRIANLARVEMVIARDRGRVERAARDFSVPIARTNWRDAMGPEVDAVLNLTPAPVHGEINLALAQSGRHVYSEKPFARDVDEGRVIRAAAAKSGAVFAAAPSVVVYPQVKRAAQILASGELGAIHSVRANATGSPPPWGGYIGDHAPFFSAEVGPLSDMGVYPLHALTGLLGNVVAVSAMGQRTRDGFAVTDGPFAGTTVPVLVQDNWQILLSLASGPLATLQVGFCTAQPAACHVEISGERGSMTVPLLDPTSPLLVFAGGILRTEPVAHERLDGPDHILGVRDFLKAIHDKRDPVINTQHALHVVAIRQAIAQAAQSGARVPVQPISSPESDE